MMKGENFIMKKKLISVLAAVMVLSFGTTAFAANSPSAVDTTVTKNEAQTTVETTATKTAEEYAAAVTVEGATTAATSQAVVDNAVATVSELTKDIAKLVDKGQISGNATGILKAAATDASKKVTVEVKTVLDVTGTPGKPVTFKVAGVTASSNILVLHYNGTNWEAIPATVADGTVTATFNSFSPVAIVEFKVDTKATSSDDNNNNNNNNNAAANNNNSNAAANNNAAATATADATAVASPKTGAAMPVVAVIAAICAAGAVVCTKKAKLN